MMESKANPPSSAQVCVTSDNNNNISASPPPSTKPQVTFQNQHDSHYNSYPTSACPSSRSSPDTSSSFTNQNSLHSISGYVLNGPNLSARTSTSHEKEVLDDNLLHPKRLRTVPSFSQLDDRVSERPSPLVLTSSHHTTLENVHHRAINSGSDSDNVKTLPPIITREERAQSTARVDAQPSLTRPQGAGEEYYNPGSITQSDEAHETLSSYKPTATTSIPSAQFDRQFSHSPTIPTNRLPFQPPPSSDPHSFSNVQHEHLPTASHLESPLSLSNHHPHSQLAVQPPGYMSTLPSPLTPVNGHASHALHNRAPYPGSPTMPMTATHSAAFSGATSTSCFAPLSPPLSQAPPSPDYCNSASTFPQQAAAHLVRSYPTSGAAPGVHGAINQANPSMVPQQPPDPSPANPKSDNAQWAAVEGQPPRRRGKLPQAVTARLRNWLMAHTGHPYPTEEEKKHLCKETDLTMNQVSNWFINARRRILVPPSGCKSSHEVRQPVVRRQAQFQHARANASAVVGTPAPGIDNQVPSSPSAVSPTFSSTGNGTFDFRYPSFAGYRSTSGGPLRPPSSPVPGHYAPYPYPLPPSSSPTTPHYDTPVYGTYGAYYPAPPNTYHHLAPPSRLHSPRSQPNTPAYSTSHVPFHVAAENHEAFSRCVSAQHHNQSYSRLSSSELPMKREWQHTQTHITDADTHSSEMSN